MKLIIFNLFSMDKTFDAVLKDDIFLQFSCFLYVFYGSKINFYPVKN